MTVALDVSLDEELIREGIAREFVNRVQNYRKDLGLDVTDKIQIFISNNSTLNKAISNFKYTPTLVNGYEIRHNNLLHKFSFLLMFFFYP